MFTTTFMTAARAKETMRGVAGVTELPNFTVQSLPQAPLTIMRLTYDKTTDGIMVNGLGNDDAFLVTLSLLDYPAFDHWCEGRFIRGSAGKAGSSSLSDLNFRHSTRLDFSFDSLHLYLPRAALNALTDDEGAPRISSLRAQPGTSVEDTVLSSLGTLLLPALSQPQHASRLFVDHVATAMLAHVAETFGDLQEASSRLVRTDLL